jgi:hypothetical protein
MRSEPTHDPNGPAPAQINVPRRHPASSTKRSQSRQAAPTWSTALPPSSHAARAHPRSKRPSSRTSRRPPAASRIINQTLPNPGGRPQLGVRRLRRLPMRSEPTPDPNGQAPAQFDVPRRHPASSTKRSQSRRAASTWSTALPPSSHAVRAHPRSNRPISRTNRRPRGSLFLAFTQT